MLIVNVYIQNFYALSTFNKENLEAEFEEKFIIINQNQEAGVFVDYSMGHYMMVKDKEVRTKSI
jgi:hypothetical protein